MMTGQRLSLEPAKAVMKSRLCFSCRTCDKYNVTPKTETQMKAADTTTHKRLTSFILLVEPPKDALQAHPSMTSVVIVVSSFCKIGQSLFMSSSTEITNRARHGEQILLGQLVGIVRMLSKPEGIHAIRAMIVKRLSGIVGRPLMGKPEKLSA